MKKYGRQEKKVKTTTSTQEKDFESLEDISYRFNHRELLSEASQFFSDLQIQL